MARAGRWLRPAAGVVWRSVTQLSIASSREDQVLWVSRSGGASQKGPSMRPESAWRLVERSSIPARGGVLAKLSVGRWGDAVGRLGVFVNA